MLHDPGIHLHDLLEEAYLAHMATSGGRWFCARRSGFVLTGFAGLDAATTSRVGRLDVTQDRFQDVLIEADAYFRDRAQPWCVSVTPATQPKDVRSELRRRGFHVAARFGIHTLEHPVPRRSVPADVHVREAGTHEGGLLTRLTIEGFEMPPRYVPALRDIAEGWLKSGARAYVAERDGVPVGMAMAVNAHGVTGVYNVTVLHRARRLGIARHLMDHLLADARERQPVTLQVARGTPAEWMYERLGFERCYDWELWTVGRPV